MEGAYKNIHPPVGCVILHPTFLISAFSDSGRCATCDIYALCFL